VCPSVESAQLQDGSTEKQATADGRFVSLQRQMENEVVLKNANNRGRASQVDKTVSI